MGSSPLGNDFNNYFYVFKAPQLSRAETAVTSSTISSEQVLKMVESSQSISGGVTLTITRPEKNTVITDSNQIESSKTYVTEPGKIIRKDVASSRSSSEDPLASRITMASVKSDAKAPSDTSMTALLDKAASQKIDISGIAHLAGAGRNESTSIVFKSRVELGEFQGSGMALSQQGDVVGFVSNGHAPLRVDSESRFSLEMKTHSGNTIAIDVSVLDQYNKKTAADASKDHVGMARDLQVSVRSDTPLTDDEKRGLNEALKALTPLANSFHENLSVTEADLSALTSITEGSDSAISSLSLNMSTYDNAHRISVDKASSEKASIETATVVDDIYRQQARSLSTATSSLGQYDHASSRNLWEKITDGQDAEWKRDIISAEVQSFEYSTRAWVASNLE